MEIGKKVKEVTTEPAPIRVAPMPIKMPDTREPVLVPARRSAPQRKDLTWGDENYLESEVPVLYCPRCGDQLEGKDTNIGMIDSCRKHGYFVTDKGGNLINVKSDLVR